MTFIRRFAALIALCLSVSIVHAADAPADAPANNPADNPHVLLKTNMGNITLELYQDKAPITVANFLSYVKSGFYKGTIFHRVIEDFMIQGGGYDKKMMPKATKSPIKNEAENGLKNEHYTLAMARTSAPNSAMSQFFINTVDNPGLDYPAPDGAGYCVFGKVIDGTETVDKIAKVPTGSRNGMENVPTEPVIIESASIVK